MAPAAVWVSETSFWSVTGPEKVAVPEVLTPPRVITAAPLPAWTVMGLATVTPLELIASVASRAPDESPTTTGTAALPRLALLPTLTAPDLMNAPPSNVLAAERSRTPELLPVPLTTVRLRESAPSVIAPLTVTLPTEPARAPPSWNVRSPVNAGYVPVIVIAAVATSSSFKIRVPAVGRWTLALLSVVVFVRLTIVAPSATLMVRDGVKAWPLTNPRVVPLATFTTPVPIARPEFVALVPLKNTRPALTLVSTKLLAVPPLL